MPTYSYIKADNSTGYTTDQKNAPGIAEHSGFQLIPDTPGAIKVPPPPQKSDLSSLANSGAAQVGANTSMLTPQTGTMGDNWLSTLFSNVPKPPSMGDLQQNLEKGANIAGLTDIYGQRQQATVGAQGKLANINAQIEALNAQAAGAQISQEGRQAPMFAISGTQAEIDRQRAIKAIPLQIQAFGAQAELAAAQGNEALAQNALTQAQGHVDSLFKSYSQDLTNQYNYQSNLIFKAIEYADKQQTRQLEALQSQIKTQNDNNAANLKFARDTALQTGDFNALSKLANLDPSSPTFAQDLSQAAGMAYGNQFVGSTNDAITAMSQAILGNESNGSYTSLSPVLKSGSYKGQRSYGKYQVLESNIPSWTLQYYGQKLTPQEFLNTPGAQEAVQKGKITELWNTYGNPQDVASVYFTGVPYAQAIKENRRDQATGMTVQDYVQKATAAFNSAVKTPTTGRTGNPTVDGWVTNIRNNTAKLSDVPKILQSAVSTALAQAPKVNEQQILQQQTSIQDVQNLLNSPGLSTSVGPNALARAGSPYSKAIGGALSGALAGGIGGAAFGGLGAIPGAIGGAVVGGVGAGLGGNFANLTGQNAQFIGAVEQLRSNLNLEKLISAKGQGATFGALSDQELRVLANAATKLGQWAITDKSGKVIGYNIDEKNFKEELDTINRYAKLDYILKGGSPSDVFVDVHPDGTYWTETWDGDYVKIR